MYSLDINLLSERPEYRSGKQTQFTSGPTTAATSQYGKVPIFIGAGVTVLSLLAIGGAWLWTGQQTTQLEAKQKELDLKLGSLKAQDQQLQQINAEVAQITDETQALASVFNQIQPWSAVLQDLRESIPQGVQIANVSQTEVKSATPAPAAAPPPATGGLAKKISTPPNPEASLTPGASPAAASTPAVPTSNTPTATLAADIPTTKLDITGTAKSFEEVNNFVLTLKQSAFFNPDDTQLLSASLGASVALTKVPPTTDKDREPTDQDLAAADKLSRLELPKVVDYKIQTSLKRIPATDLIRELERKGAVGLVTRLRSLQQQQVIK